MVIAACSRPLTEAEEAFAEDLIYAVDVAYSLADLGLDAHTLAAGLLYPLTGWLLSPVFASAAMALSSVTVVSNANRLRLFRPLE